MEILHIENLNFKYPNSENNALSDVSFSVGVGEFAVVCGESGCGKTTLLKLLKKELAPNGERSGKVLYNGLDITDIEDDRTAYEIGYVLQNPDNQIVTDKVWYELAFGLENMALPTETIRRRVGEMASYFGINEWFGKKTDELSGGQKQLLNLASVMVMQPKVLILDEPTAQLDPIAASDFYATLQKLNREFGLTIIMAEHRLEEAFPIADKVLVMDGGRSVVFDLPRNVGKRLSAIDKEHPMLSGLPSAVRIYSALNENGECPLTVREGRDFLEQNFSGKVPTTVNREVSNNDDTAIELKNVWFRYEKSLPDILRGTALRVLRGEFFCILGGNGTGKTTTLNCIAGLSRAYRGKIIVNGRPIKDYKGNSLYRQNLALLPQNPQTVFIKDTVREDFADIGAVLGLGKSEVTAKIDKISQKIGITALLDKHPYDLSGGEQQKCALAKLLLLEPQILLLDEPTKGLDAHSKAVLKGILKELKNDGITVLAVTHDIEFAAENADRCALFFDGEILSPDIPEVFFSENSFYTTAANRMARGLWKNAVTCEQVIENCLGEKYEK